MTPQDLPGVTQRQVWFDVHGFSRLWSAEVAPLPAFYFDFAERNSHQLSLPGSPLNGPTNSGVIQPP